MQGSINRLTIRGFNSIQNLDNFELNNLNVLIGANGSGKSNFIQLFHMLTAMRQQNLNKFVLERGGADRFLFNGPKVTQKIDVELDFCSLNDNALEGTSYKFELTPTVDERFLIDEYRKYATTSWRSYGPPAIESRLYDERNERSFDDRWDGVGHFIYEAMSNWVIYHFHDTSALSPMRRSEIRQDYNRLRGDGANIAPLLRHLKENENIHYNRIVDAIRLVLPFFDDFQLNVEKYGESEKVKLSWHQKESDYPMQPYHLSDGSIRFICLVTALLQPSLPSIIIIDEPELGLHPAAITVLAELIKVAATRTQLILATQSPALIDQFSVEDIVVVNRENGASTFQRLDKNDLTEWLEDYSLGELWCKNVIVGGPVYE